MIPLTNIILGTIVTYYLVYFFNLLFRGKQIVEKNEELEKLRLIPVKTIEEQRRFIELKFGKRNPSKYFAPKLLSFIKGLAPYVIIGYLIYYLLGFIKWESPLWFVLAFAVLFPLLVNWILSKWHLEQDTTLHMLIKGKWWK